MRQLMRLVRYVLPFLVQLLPGVFLLAGVGFLEAFRLMLLKPVLDRCDDEGLGAYLESSKEENIAFYNRQGFELTRRLDLPAGCPPVWAMWREPR